MRLKKGQRIIRSVWTPCQQMKARFSNKNAIITAEAVMMAQIFRSILSGHYSLFWFVASRASSKA